MLILTDPATADHDPRAEIWLGRRTPAAEVPHRVSAMREALVDNGFSLDQPGSFVGLDALLTRVHTPELLDFLRTAATTWQDAGYPDWAQADRVGPYVFPIPGLLDGSGHHDGRRPVAPHGLTGLFCYDTMTLIGPGTWRAAWAATGLAAHAAERATAGRPVYALCRPPGHHVTASAYGGSCYLNNAAVAAEALRARGFERVAVLDVDAHHGNGTQQIFYDRGDVWYGSVHVDPGAGWFPHYVGFADETGSGAGQGTNHNRPLPPGSGDQTFLDAVRDLIAQASACGPGGFGAQAVVVSLGVDAAADDPESPLQVSATGFGALGELLAEVARAVPMVLVQEGGYHLPTLGELVATVLRPLRSLRG